jgi:amidase
VSDELWRQPAGTLAQRIASREVTSREVIDAHLARIDAVNADINAIPKVLAESARLAADEADRAVAARALLGPLHGVPFTIKANIDLAGDPTTQGLRALAQAVAALDHPMVERMRRAGAIPIGRTNLPDLGLRLHTDSDLYGLTRNPWKATHTVGGSSGGDAAALAAGMTPLGLGNDIGGSLRNPAFCCGIASLKPSFGRIPHADTTAAEPPLLSAQLMAVQGPMARCVADLRLALGVLAGPHPRDPFSCPAPLEGPPPREPIRVAVVTDPPGGSTAEAIRDGVRAAADALARSGFVVEEVNPPRLEQALETWGRWLAWELSTRRSVFASVMSSDALAFFDDFVTLFGPPSGYAESLALMQTRHAIACEWSEFFAGYPIILGPTWCEPQFEPGYDLGSGGAARIVNLMRFVTPMNLLGLPVVCVPTGTANGLPLGVQVIADRFREDLCLRAAAAIEAKLGVLAPIDPRP